MTGTARVKYEITNAVYHQRKQLEESIDLDYWGGMEQFDDFYEDGGMTDIQKMIFFFLEKGFTFEWIVEHLEYDSRQAVSYHIVTIRRKLREFLENKKDEE